MKNISTGTCVNMATSLYVQTCFERKFLRKSIRNKIEILKMLFSFVVRAHPPNRPLESVTYGA